jgi:hypothetical protein
MLPATAARVMLKSSDFLVTDQQRFDARHENPDHSHQLATSTRDVALIYPFSKKEAPPLALEAEAPFN